MLILKSQEDSSVNFVFENKLEARFVQRSSDYFIVYLSSHNGCNKACRFCHLTQTKQTDFKEVTIEEYVEQARVVLNYYSDLEKKEAKIVNFNFMSRGEVLANSIFLNNYEVIFNELEKMAKNLGLIAQFNVSSIMPEEIIDIDFNKFLNSNHNITIFYSLYSTDKNFRKKWLPKAIDPLLAFSKLKDWQNTNNKLIALHWAYIKDQNDALEESKNIVNLVNSYNLNCKFNLVRYNPYSINQGVEADEDILNENFEIIKLGLGNKDSRIVPKVGFDVKASCGMFVNSN